MNHAVSKSFLSRWRSSLWTRAVGAVSCLLLINAQAPCTAPVPSDKPVNYPAWWFAQEVLVTKHAFPPWHTLSWAKGDYPAPDDFAVANIGQLKYVASQAYQMFQTYLPGGVGNMNGPDGTGFLLTQLVAGWQTPGASVDDYAVINSGQLKAVAQLFYRRLTEVGYCSGFPWGSGTADDYAAANVGQLKNVFKFDPQAVTSSNDSDNNGIPDWWESYYFGSTIGVEANSLAPVGNGLTILQCFQQGLDPIDYYNNATPQIAAVSGNGQSDTIRVVLTDPLTVIVRDSNGNKLANAPVTFQASSGGAISNGGSFTSSMVLLTDASGKASVTFLLPASPTDSALVTVTAGPPGNPARFTFSESAVAAGVPTTAVANTNSSGTTLTWSGASGDATIIVQRSTGNGSWQTIATLASGTTSYTDTNAYLGQSYSYRIGVPDDTTGGDFGAPLAGNDLAVPGYAVIDLGNFFPVTHNNNGQIAGSVNDKAAFWANNQIQPISEVQSYTHSEATVIDDTGRIAGWMTNDYRQYYSFLWTPGVNGAPNNLQVFSHDPGSVSPGFIRADGEIFGNVPGATVTTAVPNLVPHGFIFSNSGVSTDVGLVAYTSFETTLNLTIDPTAFGLAPGNVDGARLALWERLDFSASGFAVLNNDGLLVQVQYVPDGTTTTGGILTTRPAHWGSDGVVPIGTSVPSQYATFLQGLSPAGDVLLDANNPRPEGYLLPAAGGLDDLGPIQVIRMNATLQIVGQYGQDLNRPFAYDRGVFTELTPPDYPGLYDYEGAFVHAVNNSGQIVGYAGNIEQNGNNEAVLWQNGQAYNLDDLLINPDWHIDVALHIADDQSILANAYTSLDNYEREHFVMLVPFSVDVDADNTTEENYPDPTVGDQGIAEKQAQHSDDDEVYPGVAIGVNSISAIDDKIPGYADGVDIFGNGKANACGKFEPMLIHVPPLANLPNAVLKIQYSASDPNQMTETGSGPTVNYVLPEGKMLRIWKKDGDQLREPQGVDNGGDFVDADHAYTAQELGKR